MGASLLAARNLLGGTSDSAGDDERDSARTFSARERFEQPGREREDQRHRPRSAGGQGAGEMTRILLSWRRVILSVAGLLVLPISLASLPALTSARGLHSAPANAGASHLNAASKHSAMALVTCSSGNWTLDPCEASVSIGTYTSSSVDFNITNFSGSDGYVAVTSDCGVYFLSCGASPNNPWLSGDGGGVTVTFSFTSAGFTGSKDIHVTVSGASPQLVATIHVTISGPAHTLSVDAGMTNNDFQSASLCASSCFASAYSFSTVPFFTLDQPRSISLVYNGDRALPRPFVYADVLPDGGSTLASVTRYSLKANVNGSPVTFTNGDGTLYFSGSAGTRSLAGQFDARSLSSGVYPMNLVVIAHFADSVEMADTVNTELMVVNEGSSPVAAGWSIGGLERLYFPSSGYMISE